MYRKRAGSRVLRPERNGSEIGLPPAFRMRFDGCAESMVESLLPNGRTSIVSNRLVDSFESGVKRL